MQTSATLIVMAAVSQNGLSLKYADIQYKSDRDIVVAAESQNGLSLKYADDQFKSDIELIVLSTLS